MIFAGRALRSFAFGWLSVFLALFLAGKGFGAAEIGLVFTATMVEDAILTLALSTMAARWGPARVMAATAPLIALGGLLLATAESRGLLLAGAVLGTLSPNGQEAGPFAPMEQALLPGRRGKAPDGPRVRLVQRLLLPARGGGGGGRGRLSWAGRPDTGSASSSAARDAARAYAAAGVVLTLLYAGLARSAERGRRAAGALGSLGLGRTRGPVLRLARLQALDAFAGGFIMQSLLAYWFHLRFGAGPEALGALFFGTNLLSALSFLVAARVGEKIGLLNTMVFTHLPSNVLLMIVPFMPSFEGAAAMLLARHVLSQMDVPTRQAYTVALVAPEERPAAAGLAVSARALAQACAPFVSGLTMALAATPAPFLLAGGLKIVYDLRLYFSFRSLPLRDGA